MKLLKYLLIIVLAFVFVSESFSQDQIWVDGYIKKDGTYVKGHYRTKPDGDPFNNYSYPGNYNPNTGKITTGNPDTYLINYYKENHTPDIRTDYNNDFNIDLGNY
ncbi:MAG: hypothetical protein V3U16_06225, partial [Candidatus Neomarinimicrobiota bacterium]